MPGGMGGIPIGGRGGKDICWEKYRTIRYTGPKYIAKSYMDTDQVSYYQAVESQSPGQATR